MSGERFSLAAIRSAAHIYAGSRSRAFDDIAEVRRDRFHIEALPLYSADWGAYQPRAELAFWSGGRATLRKVERRAKRIGKKKVAFAKAMETGLLAGVAARRKRFAKAAQLFEEAARDFDKSHMKLDAAACRIRQGEILGGERGRTLIADAEAVFREEDVADPERFAHAMYAPRFPLP